MDTRVSLTTDKCSLLTPSSASMQPHTPAYPFSREHKAQRCGAGPSGCHSRLLGFGPVVSVLLGGAVYRGQNRLGEVFTLETMCQGWSSKEGICLQCG